MNKIILIALFSGLALCTAACSKPDIVTKYVSPTEGVYYTVETFKGHGAIDNDYAWVYAHFENGGKSDKEVVMSGEYLEISKIIWNNPRDATLCYSASATNDFRSMVVLRAGGVSVTIHNHLREGC
jgi:hypothetical protein